MKMDTASNTQVCEDYCSTRSRKYYLAFFEWIAEGGRTGKRFDRPGLLRMLAIAPLADVIVVWRLDRFVPSLRIF